MAITSSYNGDYLNLETNESANIDQIKSLYPMVNEDETPLPRCWSSRDKYSFIGLSQSNLRVHYKGFGKSHKDAASVRAAHPIPSACGLYYYEVKIVSKGRDGYMGIGLAAQGVNMNRLPGWDKNSYGYHGDDGHSFCSSGTGQPYGPTFTTGDVIGCGINLIDNLCFYTKNGHYLGVAFTELPQNLYPTVGLQTPGEVVDANFGQLPFIFDIQEMRKELRNRERITIQKFPVGDTYGEWQTMLHRMVSTYLVHHGYCATAEAFAHSTSQDLEEELASIRNRQRIQKLVLSGRIGAAIKLVKELYPSLLDRNKNLLFIIKVRQFIEMINGSDTDSEVISNQKSENQTSSMFTIERSSPPNLPSPDSNVNSVWMNGSTCSDNIKLAQPTPVIQSTKDIINNLHNSSSSSSLNQQPSVEELNQRNSSLDNNNSVIQSNHSNHTFNQSENGIMYTDHAHDEQLSQSERNSLHNLNGSANSNAARSQSESNCHSVTTSSACSSNSHLNNDSDVDMECPPPLIKSTADKIDSETPISEDVHKTKTSNDFINGFENGFNQRENEEDMDIETNICNRVMCNGDSNMIERMLALGKELQKMSENLRKELGKNRQNKIMLQDAFSLLAYNDPWNSPVGWQLDPIQREPVCQALNSAILESHDLPRRPPLEVCVSHTKQLIDVMSKSSLGSCAFASVESILHNHGPADSTCVRCRNRSGEVASEQTKNGEDK